MITETDGKDNAIVLILKSTGGIVLFIVFCTIVSGNFYLPIDLPVFTSYNYPSIITGTMIGSTLIICTSWFEEKYSPIKTICLTLAILFSAVFGWEAIYHYAFPIYLNYFKLPFINLQENNFYLFLLLVIIAFITYHAHKKTIYINKYAIASFVVFLVMFTFWILNGYPQKSDNDGTTYYSVIINVGLANSFIGMMLVNFIAKFSFYAFFILICKNQKIEKEK